jgi:integrase
VAQVGLVVVGIGLIGAVRLPADAAGHQCWGDVVTVLATTAMRISESTGLLTSDVDLGRGILHVNRQTYPGRGGLVTKETKGRRRLAVPIIDPLRPTLERPTSGDGPDDRLIVGPKGGTISTATLRDATHWDWLVNEIWPIRAGSPRIATHRAHLDG